MSLSAGVMDELELNYMVCELVQFQFIQDTSRQQFE
jgi:hypothetical protein